MQNVKTLVGAFNQEKAPVWACSMIVKSSRRFVSSSFSRATLGHWGNCDITPPPSTPLLNRAAWEKIPGQASHRGGITYCGRENYVTNGDTQSIYCSTVPHTHKRSMRSIRDPCTVQNGDRWTCAMIAGICFASSAPFCPKFEWRGHSYGPLT